MKKLIGTYIALLFFLCCSQTSEVDYPENQQPLLMKKVNENDFLKTFSGKGVFPVTILSEVATSNQSGNTYAYFEVSAFSADGNTSTLITHSDRPIVLTEGLLGTEISYRKIRTFLEPSFQKQIDSPGKDPIPADLFEEGPVQVYEFGLISNQKYYAQVRTETYNLPPAGPDSMPRKRTNQVLVLSDSPEQNPDDQKLTPLYRGWTY